MEIVRSIGSVGFGTKLGRKEQHRLNNSGLTMIQKNLVKTYMGIGDSFEEALTEVMEAVNHRREKSIREPIFRIRRQE